MVQASSAQPDEVPRPQEAPAEGSAQAAPPRAARAKALLGTKPRRGADAQQPLAEAQQPRPSLICRLARWLNLA